MDTVSPEVRSRIMSAIRSKDTRPEVALRRALTALGLRYRVHLRGVSGPPDVAFPRARLAVFVDSEFWHFRPGTKVPKTNRKFWAGKLKGNRARDLRVKYDLRKEGWGMLRLWAADVERNPGRCARAVARAVGKRLEAMAWRRQQIRNPC